MSEKKEAKKQRIQSINNQISELESEISGLRSRLDNLENSEKQVKDNHKWFEFKQKANDKDDIKSQIYEVKSLIISAEAKIKGLEKQKKSLSNKTGKVALGSICGIIIILSIIIGIVSCGKLSNDDSNFETTTLSQFDEQTTDDLIQTTAELEISLYNDTEIAHTSKYDSNNAILACGGTAIKSIDSGNLPKYSGKAYSVINNNVPAFPDDDMYCLSPFEKYNSLDSLGRCGFAYANVCKETMPTKPREKIETINPSGWQTVKYDTVDSKQLYNRCLLIGYQLSAENSNNRDIITGTRYLTVNGILPFENTVADYVKRTGNHVLYRVTPIFVGKELVARGVQIEAYSVEDNGTGICFNVYCYNIQPGVTINYADGSSVLGDKQTGKATTKVTAKANTKATTKATAKVTTKATTKRTTKATTKATTKKTTKATTRVNNNNSQTVYITDTGSKYHRAGCRHLKSSHPISKADAINAGYTPCGTCCPG